MHILLIHQAFAGINEPGGTRHHEIANFLAEAGHHVTIIASPVSYLTGKSVSAKWKVEEESDNPNIRIIRAFTYQKLHRSFVHRMISFFSFMFSSFWIGIGIKNVDLVWGTSPPLFQAPSAWLIAALKRKPFLLEIRDLWPLFAVEVGVLKNKLLIRLSEWLEKFLYRRANVCVVNSPGYIQHVCDRGGKRVELVSNGSDPDMFHPEDRGEAFRKEHGLEGKFVVAYAGAHGMSNDLGVVLEAARLLKADERIHFLFVGDGKEKENLQRAAAEFSLPNVTFLPPVVKSKMHEVFSAVDGSLAILKPIEVYKTTYPNKVFDGMAAGRPVILAIDGVSREVIERHLAGIFTPPGDAESLAKAVMSLANDPEKARKMGENGRQAVQQ
ncbi:MAG: glycosyltransferase family 4 protein, partial [Anaerolineae bacterium]|nr:glycosyltransferase family 4 protein [Anaerolineae bacterium]